MRPAASAGRFAGSPLNTKKGEGISGCDTRDIRWAERGDAVIGEIAVEEAR